MIKKKKKPSAFKAKTLKLKKIKDTKDLAEIFELNNYLLDFPPKIEELSEKNYQHFDQELVRNHDKVLNKAQGRDLKTLKPSPYLLDLTTELTKVNEEWSKETPIKLKTKKKLISLPKLNLDFKQRLNFSNNLRVAFNFFIISLLIILPLISLKTANKLFDFKNLIIIKSVQAVSEIKSAANLLKDQNLPQAIKNFNQASDDFDQARQILKNNNPWWQITKNLPLIKSQSAAFENILSVGSALAKKASSLTNFYLDFSNKNENLIKNFDYLDNNLSEISQQFSSLNNSLLRINSSFLPQEFKLQFINFKEQITTYENNLVNLKNYFSLLKEILGYTQKNNYLVFFQNNNELRATGGFLGSFAIITVENGEVKKMEIPGGGPYDLKGTLTKKVISPSPMHLVGSRWQIWDANWWPDFPTSAEKIIWFYEASGGMTVDGVIAINADVLPELLKITGDLELPDYQKTLTSDNIIETLQTAVEFEYDKEENKPKQIIADLAPILIDRLLKADIVNFPKVINLLSDSLINKDLQMYFRDPQIQKSIINFDWAGQVKDTNGDYLMVVSQNIGGGKTDKVIRQELFLTTEISAAGRILNNLEITRSHQGDPNDIFEKTNNVSYLRIYLPEGSEIIAAEGGELLPAAAFKPVGEDFIEDADLKKISGEVYYDQQKNIYLSNEFNKTVVGFWSQLLPNQSKSFKIKYQLPFNITTAQDSQSFFDKILLALIKPTANYYNYNLLVQKQSGTTSSFNSQIILPETKKLIWSSDPQLNSNLNYQKNLTSDSSLAAIIEW